MSPFDEKDMRRMVHTFTMNGFNFAVDGNSGSIHVLEDISCQLLSGMQKLIPLNDAVENFKTNTLMKKLRKPMTK